MDLKIEILFTVSNDHVYVSLFSVQAAMIHLSLDEEAVVEYN